MDRVYENEIEQRDVAAKQHHRDNDHDGRVSQLLVFADPFFFRVPRPGSFLKLDLNFVEKVFRFSNHGTDLDLVISLLRANHARRDSNPQQAVLETATLPIEL